MLDEMLDAFASAFMSVTQNFEVLLNIFEFSRLWEIAESWLVYTNKFSVIA